MISVHFTDEPVVDFASSAKGNNDTFKKYFHGMLSKGVYLSEIRTSRVVAEYSVGYLLYNIARACFDAPRLTCCSMPNSIKFHRTPAIYNK